MASVRSLKKDINFLASELVTQAYLGQILFKDTTEDELINTITEALEFRNSLIARANHPDGKDNPKLVKSYYQKVRKDMVERFSELFDKHGKQIESN
ncbi:hypothetical protein [Alkaliflexus imshenetskii]|jgi:hypothetical protein|uniref:hypothetical protein n=1 Tax=Alkaliflexus imshenetskii TaxID=286730 RepID=UPI00047E77F6|nr:hypothetical protein [Alkaliflexus imshenetskii]